jgi:UDP-N-acetyl-D-mannosaminuronate dehydrogenase
MLTQVILAGCAINDWIPRDVATMAVWGLNQLSRITQESKCPHHGLTYKENVPDTCESPAENMALLYTGHLHFTQIMQMREKNRKQTTRERDEGTERINKNGVRGEDKTATV